jgi:hypothetical protein
MKKHKKTTVSKLVTRFDHELKTILINDLNNVRTVKDQFLSSNNQALLKTSLSVA